MMAKKNKKSVKKKTKKIVKKAKPSVKKTAKKAVAKNEKDAKPAKGGKLIMVVDDEADVRNTVKTVLENAGFKVVTAVNASDCLRKLQKVKPALILLDIMMPGMPVKEAIPKMGNVKIAYLSVVRTSEAEKEDLLKSKKVVAFIQKPFDVDKLVAKVKRLAGK